jgi:hypothetical protein
MMTRMIAIRKIKLQNHHLSPGRTKHRIVDNQGARDFPPFTALAITQSPGESGCYLMHLCDDGQAADTWHENLEDALHQAEWEFGVKPAEWQEVNEPF